MRRSIDWRRLMAGAIGLGIATVLDAAGLPRGRGQADQIDRDRQVAGALLGLPAPLPGSLDEPRAFDAPADDASPEVLVRYWGGFLASDAPDAAVRERILDAVEQYPGALPSVLDKLPDTPLAHARVLALWNRHASTGLFSRNARDRISTYLMLRTDHRRDDLVARARNARDGDRGWESGDTQYLVALARLDWDRARPLLERHAAATTTGIASVALGLLHARAVEHHDPAAAERHRRTLSARVSDTRLSGRARDAAVRALMSVSWPGQDEWVLSLFSDASLRRIRDGDITLSPVSAAVRDAPDRWIPKIVPLVGHANRAVHQHAVDALVQFYNRQARRDALVPLLPWLDDPRWAEGGERLRLIQSMSFLDVPDSVPGLIAVLDQNDRFDRSYAADALIKYRDPRSVPSLRRALDREHVSSHRHRIIAALLAIGGLEPDQTASALYDYVVMALSPGGRERLTAYQSNYDPAKALDLSPAIGLFLAEYLGAWGDRIGYELTVPDASVARVLARIEEIQTGEPAVAARMEAVVDGWNSRAGGRHLIARIGESRADASAILAALTRREALRRDFEPALQAMAGLTGVRAGLAAVLLSARTRMADMLAGPDAEARLGVLAASRLLRDQLPIDAVIGLLQSSDALSARAAEAYLIAEDAPAGRTAVWRRYPGEAMILGARPRHDPGHSTFAVFDRWEANLRAEVLAPAGPTEILALISAGIFGSAGHVVVKIFPDRTHVLTYRGDTPAPSSTRFLSAVRLAELRAFLVAHHVDDLGPFSPSVADGMQFEYLRIGRNGGRRVFMNNPGLASGTIYDLICARMRALPALASRR